MPHRILWVLAGYLLLLISPSGRPSVPKAYGAFPLAQGTGGKVHVKQFVLGFRDGNSCDTGYATIQQGIEEARRRGAGLVEVCDSSVYAENVIMRDGINLISQVGAGLTTAEEVLLRCIGETDPVFEPLPTIVAAGPGPVVSFNSLKRPTFIKGFHITGGVAPSGGGILCLNSNYPSIIANCIHDNEAQERGGGIGIENAKSAIVKTNAILSNTSNGDGGGIACVNSPELLTEDNLIEFNEAQNSGGALFLQQAKKAQGRKNEIIANRAKEGFGGGDHWEKVDLVEYENCRFVEGTCLKKGGGGINMTLVKKAKITNCQFVQCESGKENTDPGDLEKFTGDPSGGAIGIEGSTAEIIGGIADTCKSGLDGGGVLVIGKGFFQVFPPQGAVERAARADITNMLIKGCEAKDDGGGVSATLKGEVNLKGDTRLRDNKALTNNGGGLHVTCNSYASTEGILIEENRAKQDGGGIFVRNSGLLLSTRQAGIFTERTVVRKNAAEDDGGGMMLLTNDEGIIECNNLTDSSPKIHNNTFVGTTATMNNINKNGTSNPDLKNNKGLP